MLKFLKNNWFLFSMILGILLGIAVGFAWPDASALEPLGTLFINMMFCVVVPTVFCSISSSIRLFAMTFRPFSQRPGF